MKIQLKQIKIKDLFEGYKDSKEEGIVGYGGLLNIRPAYQREFVYKDDQRDAVVRSVMSKFPLNTMYWSKNLDGTYELLDGQQRTISICSYLNGEYSIDYRYYKGLTEEEKQQILNYELQVYICEGSDKEKLEWFRVINVAGEKLTDQELLNINYTGQWLTDAKNKFSKNNCVAYNIAKDYVKGSPIRQELLETALDWISNGKIADYMSKHQLDSNANELWLYFNSVITWVKTIFGEDNYRKEMKSVEWGYLYNKYKDNKYNAIELENQISELMANEEVTNKKGVYEYVLSYKDETLARKLSKRSFSEREKRTVYETQKGICPICGKHYSIEEMEGDHIIPWWKGGFTVIDNLQMLCKQCNVNKSGK